MNSVLQTLLPAISLFVGLSVALAAPSAVEAQLPSGGGTLHLFSDADFTDSTYQDQSISIVKVYVVHRGITFGDVRAVQFMLQASSGLTFTWISESSPMPFFFGSSQTGIGIDYAACLFPDPGLILEIQYLGFGTSQACSSLRVVAHPITPSGEIEVFLCVGQGPVSAVGGVLLVNCPLPVEPTTWGKVKNLYRTR